MARSILEILIQAKDEASSAFKKLNTEAGNLNKGIAGLNNVLGFFGLALGAKTAIDFANATREAARAEEDALNALKASADGIDDYNKALQLAKEQTQGMASQQQLASSLSTLFGAGLAKSSDEAAKLANAGTILSGVFKDAGASQELYVRLLSSGSPVLFNNFGLTAQMVEAKQKEIEATTGLSGEEAKQQALKEVLIAQAQKYQSALSDETIAQQQNAAAQADFMASFGNLVNAMDEACGTTAFLTTSLQSLTEGARAWQVVLQEQIPVIREWQEAQAVAASETAKVNPALAQYRQNIQASVPIVEEATEATEEYTAMMPRFAAAADTAAAAQQTLAEEIRKTTQAQQMAQFGPHTNREAEAYRQMAEARAGTVEIQADFQKQIEQERIDEQKEAEAEAAQQMTRAFTQAADTIGNTISSKLTTTFQEVFKLPDNAEHADEPARRLATVAAAGFGSEWLTQLNTQFAGMDFWQPIAQAMQSGDEAGLKAAATTALQQFSQGLIKDLWDVDAIKAQIRQEAQAKQIKTQLTEEIAKELGAQGVSQAIGVVEIAAGNVGVATAQTETNVSTMATTAQTAGGQIKSSFDEALIPINTLIVRIGELNKTLERTKVLAGEAGGAIGGLNPPNAPGGGVPNDAQKKMGGSTPL